MELPTISDRELRERSRGILLGLACGESISGTLALTHLALELGESVIARGEIEPELLLDRWERLEPESSPRPGSITAQALRLFKEGFPAEGLAEATARLAPDRSGDGPLPRALPLAIAARQDGALLKRWANQSASVTHSDLTSRMATVGSCLLARDLLTRGLDESLARVAQALREEAPLRLSRALHRPSRDELPESGDDAVAVLSQAIHALAAGSDLEGVLQEVDNQEMPTHGALALAGGLGGAAFGIDPSSRRLGRLDQALRLRLEELADRLVDFEIKDHASRVPAGGASFIPSRDD
ncbi:MAG TPA: ADP-ribosylglycohydrolase family protein [Candidatus Dormibacteraeota bacterium]|nr:ADP-ribosylglycohydrolase family protein [Candidatus Dormibacteraeota bacterium]